MPVYFQGEHLKGLRNRMLCYVLKVEMTTIKVTENSPFLPIFVLCVCVRACASVCDHGEEKMH